MLAPAGGAQLSVRGSRLPIGAGESPLQRTNRIDYVPCSRELVTVTAAENTPASSCGAGETSKLCHGKACMGVVLVDQHMLTTFKTGAGRSKESSRGPFAAASLKVSGSL